MYHTDLEIWKKSIELVKMIYKLTENFPAKEQFGLISQIRRAAVSIPSNIAEGSARASHKDAIRFADIALGSLSELETQLIIAKELDFVDSVQHELDLLKQVNALAMGLRKYYIERSE